jgi:Flp pilus assembly protein TadG
MLACQAKSRRGVAAIETALLLPLLVLLIFGMIEFGLLLYNRQVLTNASREGARFGIVQWTPRRTDGEIEAVVNLYCASRLVTFGSAGGPSTTVTREGAACVGSPCCQAFDDDLAVRVTYQYNFLVLTNFGFGPIQLEAQTVMKCE